MLLGAVTACLSRLATLKAAEPDPAVMTFRLPKDIQWDASKTRGNQQIVLYGNPEEPGSDYGIIQKWFPNSMSHPHFHENDRYIYVVSGTWWVGWGTKYDPASTYPMPAGSFVHHIAKQIHYDGAKETECIIYVTGKGPARSTNAEVK
jgi:hypothetical protein